MWLQVAFRTTCSAGLDLVALVCTEACVIIWAPGVACGWVVSLIAFADLLLVLIIAFAFAHEIGSHLDGGATHLDFGLLHARDVLRSKEFALVQARLAGTIAKGRLALNVHFLVDVNLGLVCELEFRTAKTHQTKEDNLRELHC